MLFFFFQAEDGIRDVAVTGVQTCALPISSGWTSTPWFPEFLLPSQCALEPAWRPDQHLAHSQSSSRSQPKTSSVREQACRLLFAARCPKHSSGYEIRHADSYQFTLLGILRHSCAGI